MKKVKVIAVIVAILALGIGGFWLYESFFRQPPPIIPPPTEHSFILIDLVRPDEGVISLSYPSDKTSGDDFMLVADAAKDAVDILDRYYIPYVDPATIKPSREASVVTVSFGFFAKDKQEFIWPECLFTSTWTPVWQIANMSLILPKGYEVVNIETKNLASEPIKTFENDRWKITIRTREWDECQMKVIYKKST